MLEQGSGMSGGFAVGVVDGPVGKLDAVELGMGVCVGYVKDGDGALGIGEEMPEGAGADVAGIERAYLVGAGFQLVEPVIAVVAAWNTGREGDPNAMFREEFVTCGGGGAAFGEQAGEGGHATGGEGLRHGAGAGRIESENKKWTHLELLVY